MGETQQYVDDTSSSCPPYTSCGVQCSFPIADTKCNASTQTEERYPNCFLEQGIRVEEIEFEEVVNATVDHPYSAKELTTSHMKGCSGVLPAPSSQFPDSELDSSPLQPSNDWKETEYVISSEEFLSSTDDEKNPTAETNKTYIEEPKYLVFGSCLNSLLKFS